ncbi:MAG: BrnA antitoxin family protein [Bdellovibrionales bacterium]|nr:BrnA antitoxin family protein [Bdellovibrionales bacterium]
MSTMKDKINYGEKDLLSKDQINEAFEPKNMKQRVTIFLDADIVDYFKQKAKLEGNKYQTLINNHLRKATYNQYEDESLLFQLEAMKEKINFLFNQLNIDQKPIEKKVQKSQRQTRKKASGES